ncbi:hypothetical protein [uncultured Pseudonocardia sp.]|mgnify:CR=1 FL=1|uniref:hypothetical protein n=1 Tax=uncultured Pseudonocardia sp. TaxID=211455 RepID=UPI00260ECE95|nr:hypothetical protein [uncultured Pseudonocardia sp.]
MLAARREVAEAAAVLTRAQADQAAAERRAGDDRSAAEQLRAELARVRREAAEERAALRQEGRQQFDAVLSRFSTEPTTTEVVEPDIVTPTPRRGRSKTAE